MVILGIVLAAVAALLALSFWLNGRPAARRLADAERRHLTTQGEVEPYRAAHSTTPRM